MKTKSRKNFFFLLIILLIPIFFFFGCDTLNIYRIDVYTNEYKNGTVYGYGTYTEGDTVTLQAYGLNGNRFIAWVYQNKTILTNNSTYQIVTSDDGLSSTLTFTASQSTADRYTAVFEDDSQQYYTLSSYKFTSDIDADEPSEENLTDVLVSGVSLNVLVGDSLTTLREAAYLEGDFRDGVTNEVSDVTQVMNLSYTTEYYIRFNLTLSGGQSSLRTITVILGEDNSSNGVSLTFNSNNSFDVIYSFQITTTINDANVTQNVFLVLTFSPLSYTETE